MDNSKPIGWEELIQGIRELDNQALTQVAGEVEMLLNKRQPDVVTEREATLVKQIKAGIPASIKRRQKQLYALLQKDAISQKEREELLLLNNFLEEKAAERIELMGELARLRGISPQKIAAEFKTWK